MTGKLEIIKSHLTDGSDVFAVSVSDGENAAVFDCISEKHAITLLTELHEALNKAMP